MSANAEGTQTNTESTTTPAAATAQVSTQPAAGAQVSGTPAADATKVEAEKTKTSLLSVEPEKKPEGDKSKTGEASKGDQAKIEIKLPEGMKVDADALKAFEAVATTQKLTSEQASALAVFEHERRQQEAKANEAAWDKQSDAWAEALKKEHGDKFDAKLLSAKQTLRKYGGEAVARELNRLKIDNHPALFNMLAAIGEAEGEDKAHAGGAGTGNTAVKLSAKDKWDNFYDHPSSVRAS